MSSDAPSTVDPAQSAHGPDGLGKLRRISGTDRRILLVSAATVASRLLAKVAQLAFLVVAARVLSVEEFAGYSYLVVLAVTFSMLADTGVALAASREISSGRASPSEAFWSSLPVIGAGGVLGGAAVVAFGLADSAPGSAGTALVLTCLVVVSNTLFNFAATTLRGVGRQVYEAVLQGASALVFVGAAGIVLAAGGGLVPVLAVLLAKELLSAALALAGLGGHVGRARPAAAETWRRLVRIGLQLGMASTALALVVRLPTLVLGNGGSASELAWFSAGQRLADAVLVLATTTGFALLPSLALLLEAEPPRAWRLVRRALGAGLAVGALVAVLSALLAEDLVTVAFGSDFDAAAGSTRVLMAGAPAYALVGLGWYTLVALGRARLLLAIATGGAALSLGLALALVPGSGDEGAASAYVAALAAMAGAMLLVLTRARRRV